MNVEKEKELPNEKGSEPRTKKKAKLAQLPLPEEIMKSSESFAIKEEPSSTDNTNQEQLTIKEIFKLLDEAKKKTFNKYYKWKFSLYNESNV